MIFTDSAKDRDSSAAAIAVCGLLENLKAESCGKDSAALVYSKAYAEGDSIVLTSSEKNQYLVIQLDDAVTLALVFFTEGVCAERSIRREESALSH